MAKDEELAASRNSGAGKKSVRSPAPGRRTDGSGSSPKTSPRAGSRRSKGKPEEAKEDDADLGASAKPSPPTSPPGRKAKSKDVPRDEPANGAERVDNEAKDLANGSEVDHASSNGERLSNASSKSMGAPVPAPQPQRVTTIGWDQVVAVGSLIVPICKEHGMSTMQFRKGDGDGATSIEMSDLLDWVRESRAVGAKAMCTECGANLGVILKKGDKGAPRHFGPDVPTGPRLATTPSWLPAFCVGCDLSLGKGDDGA